MILPDLANKRRIILVENVTTEFAQMYSSFYPNVIFFTNDQTIWKNGQCYTQPISVDKNQNKIPVNDLIYELQLENNVLKFVTKEYLYWGIFGDNDNSILVSPDITRYNIKGVNENGFGWRKITDDENIISCKIDFLTDTDNKLLNPFYKYKDNSITDAEYNKTFIGPVYDIRNKENKTNIIKFDKNIKYLHIFIPKILIDFYHVGIYDDLDGSDLLKKKNDINPVHADSTNFMNAFFKDEDISKFEIYNHYIIKASSNINAFNLRIYSKDKKLIKK